MHEDILIKFITIYKVIGSEVSQGHWRHFPESHF